MTTVHPSLRSYAELLGQGMDLSATGIAATNSLIDAIAAARWSGPADPTWSERTVSVEHRRHSTEVVVAGPTAAEPSGVLVWVHGGGFVSGRPEQDLDLLRDLCAPTRTVAVAVRYRLAPAADLDDMVADVSAGLAWVRHTWPEAVIVAGGESAGGALAVLSLLGLTGSGPCPVADALVLLGPLLDDATADPDHREWVWSARNCRDAWARAGVGHTRNRPPARHTALRGLPPTHVEYGDLDVVAPETRRFAARLRSCQVQVVEHRTPGAVHGFVHAGPGPLVDAALARMRHTLLTARRADRHRPLLGPAVWRPAAGGGPR